MIPADMRDLVNHLEQMCNYVDEWASAPTMINVQTMRNKSQQARQIVEGVWRMHGRGME